MRYSREHQEATKAKIQSGVSRAFRKHGYSGIGVDGLAKHAGATSGAFYGLFESKDEAFRFAVDTGLQELADGIRAFKRDHGPKWFDEFITWYLSESHRKDMAGGCALVTLSPEVVRADRAVRNLYAKQFAAVVDEIAQGLQDGTIGSRRARARAILALLAGAVTLSRAVGNDSDAQMIAAAARHLAESAEPSVETRD